MDDVLRNAGGGIGKCGMLPHGRLFPNHCLPRGSIPHFHDRDITPELELFWLLAKTRTNIRPSS